MKTHLPSNLKGFDSPLSSCVLGHFSRTLPVPAGDPHPLPSLHLSTQRSHHSLVALAALQWGRFFTCSPIHTQTPPLPSTRALPPESRAGDTAPRDILPIAPTLSQVQAWAGTQRSLDRPPGARPPAQPCSFSELAAPLAGGECRRSWRSWGTEHAVSPCPSLSLILGSRLPTQLSGNGCARARAHTHPHTCTHARAHTPLHTW